MEWIIQLVAVLALLDPNTKPCAALTAADQLREAAWANADSALLSSLYLAESTDVAALANYQARGLVVRGVRQVRAECRDAGNSAVVVERLARSVAVDAQGRERKLPAGGWTRRKVTWQFDGRYKIAEITELSPPKA